MRIRPEAEARLRQGFQRRAGIQSARYAPHLADAEQFAVRFQFGEVVAVFTTRAGGEIPARAYVVALLPLAAIPLLMISAGLGAVMVPLLALFPFLFDDNQRPQAPVRWREVAEVREVWTEVPNSEDATTVLSAYSLRCGDGRTYEIVRSFENVRDPYGKFGRSLGAAMPAVRATMPRFPAIDDVIAAWTR